jgi:hypothetical protein
MNNAHVTGDSTKSGSSGGVGARGFLPFALIGVDVLDVLDVVQSIYSHAALRMYFNNGLPSYVLRCIISS